MMPFFGCLALKSIVVSEDNGQYDSRGGCNAIIETETNELIAGCDYTVIPDDVTRIGSRALSGCQGLTSITIPADNLARLADQDWSTFDEGPFSAAGDNSDAQLAAIPKQFLLDPTVTATNHLHFDAPTA